MDYGYKPTTTGRAILAACLATEMPLVLTRVAMGSGTVPEGTNLADVHELVNYVAEGSLGERTHKDDRLYLTVQYENSANPTVSTFYLSEFIVYAKHPETGEEGDLLYATLGDYMQPVPAYSPSLPPSVWKFPLTLVVSDEIEVSVTGAAGLVTYDDLQEAVEKACAEMLDKMATGGIKKTIEFSIPADAWVEDSGMANGYVFYYDLVDPEITSKMIPNIVIAEDSLMVAALADVCVTATSYAGYVRMKCVERPTDDILATCHLLLKGSTGSGGGSTYILPVASNDTLGGVKVQEGSGLVIDTDGNLSVDAASEEETAIAIDEVFSTEGAETSGE